MEKNNKKRKIVIGITMCAIVLLSLLGTYAFFVNSSSNNKNQNISVGTGNLSLIFEDGSDSFQGSLNFGDSATKSFTIENTGSLNATAVMYFENLVNTYILGSLTYTLSYSETLVGEYTELVSDKNIVQSNEPISKILTNKISVPAGKKYYYKLKITLNNLPDVDQTADLSAIFSTNFKLQETANSSLETLQALGLTSKEGSINFGIAATTDKTGDGLYSLPDDYGTSYYFRGNVKNNYVKFAGFYWRIIRINGDGSLRVIYDGTKGYTNSTANEDRVALTSIIWNSENNDAKYAGYMYGGSNGVASTSKEQAQSNETNSNIKIQLEAWYKEHIADRGYDDYVSDTLFCNDRSIPGQEISGVEWDTGLGYGNNPTIWGPTAREGWEGATSYTKPQPQFTCPNKNDAFTKNDISKGNGKLEQKVGLITADEIIAAGSGKFGTANSSYYLYKGVGYWSLSPSNIDTYEDTRMYSIEPDGNYSDTLLYEEFGMAPVINISANYASEMIGSGTITDPYRAVEFNALEAVKAVINNRKPKNVQTITPNIGKPSKIDEGVYAMEDDYGTSYYYRGAVENNYVKFAGFYWRIIRINGDGTLRIQYDGKKAWSNGIANTTRLAIQKAQFNNNVDDAKYAGYMYGGANGEESLSIEEAQTNTTNSIAKTKVDTWYKTNIEDKGYSSYIADSIFCNDRSTDKSWWDMSSETPGFSTNVTAYGFFNRQWTFESEVKYPSNTKLTCPNKNDAFTVKDTTKGNGKLTYPVGLITADELVLAGSTTEYIDENINTNFYLYKGYPYWTLSPLFFWYNFDIVYEAMLGYDGIVEDGDTSVRAGGPALGVSYSVGLAPVINLTVETAKTLIGTGYATDPYRLPDTV